MPTDPETPADTAVTQTFIPFTLQQLEEGLDETIKQRLGEVLNFDPLFKALARLGAAAMTAEQSNTNDADIEASHDLPVSA